MIKEENILFGDLFFLLHLVFLMCNVYNESYTYNLFSLIRAFPINL